MSSDDDHDREREDDRRRASIPVEKMAGLVISGTALAFGLYTAGTAYLDGLQHDINRLAADAAVLDARFDAYNREREQWIERIKYLESRCAEIRERIGDHRGGAK